MVTRLSAISEMDDLLDPSKIRSAYQEVLGKCSGLNLPKSDKAKVVVFARLLEDCEALHQAALDSIAYLKKQHSLLFREYSFTCGILRGNSINFSHPGGTPLLVVTDTGSQTSDPLTSLEVLDVGSQTLNSMPCCVDCASQSDYLVDKVSSVPVPMDLESPAESDLLPGSLESAAISSHPTRTKPKIKRNRAKTVLPQCYNCQRYGHVASNCSFSPSCRLCGKSHNTRNCPSTDDQPCCANCQQAHKASSRTCGAFPRPKKKFVIPPKVSLGSVPPGDKPTLHSLPLRRGKKFALPQRGSCSQDSYWKGFLTDYCRNQAKFFDFLQTLPL